MLDHGLLPVSEAGISRLSPCTTDASPAEALLALMDADIDHGRSMLRDTAQKLIACSRPDLAPCVSGDDALLEPLLFQHFSQSRSPAELDGILFKHLAAQDREVRADVVTDPHGHLYLPGLGQVLTDAPNAAMTLVRSAGETLFRLETPEGPLPFHLEPLAYASPGIELTRHPIALHANVFVDDDGRRVDVDASSPALARGTQLAKAFVMLGRAWPQLLRTFGAVTRRVVLFESQTLNSFVVPSLPGTAFLNAALGRDEIFLIEDLAHQCGHVAFMFATHDGADYLRLPPAQTLGSINGRDDARSLYVALHGLVTEAFMTVCLDRCLGLDLCMPQQRHEVRGRLAFIAQRFGDDAASLFRADVLSDKGMRFVGLLMALLRDVVDRRRDLLTQADFSGQGYNFDYEAYVLNNPETPEIQSSRTLMVRRPEAMTSATRVSRLGFGGYRIAAGHPGHRAALTHALDLGCTLIDTACNYGEGRSEQLIGDVLANHLASRQAYVVTKVGYLPHAAQQRLSVAGIDIEALPSISEESRYSLSVDVIRAELAESRLRLRRPHDAVLLHNPEHLSMQGAAGKPWHGVAKEALAYLEECVQAGELDCYGISSNLLASEGAAGVEDWVRLAESVSADHHFRLIEFPFNLIENTAAAPGGVIETIRRHGLRSIGNRPLTAQRSQGNLRLATYPEKDPPDDASAYQTCVDLVARQLQSAGIEHHPMDFMVMQFLRDNRRGIGHPDAVDGIFHTHVYPFVQQLWSPSAPEVRAFATLHDMLRWHALDAMNTQAQDLRKELIEQDLIAPNDPRPFALIACDYALRSGLDHVVVGMRAPHYVDSLRNLLQ